MILHFSNEGSIVDRNSISGFHFDENRDIVKQNKIEGNNELNQNDEYFNFVGFVTNDNDDIYTVFPKHFEVSDNIEYDIKLLFKVLRTHIQKHPSEYFGPLSDQIYKSNFPFESFFKIYDFYEKYGLYFDETIFIKTSGNKISWKDTIRRSQKYIIDGKITIFPIYYKKTYRYNTFLTECMIFAINYTLHKFSSFINLESIDSYSLNTSLINNIEATLYTLYEMKNITYKDKILDLIDCLIRYFSELKIGGNFYIKHYSFSSIWENMVESHLNNYYSCIDDGKIVLDYSHKYNNSFKKETFHPNAVNDSHSIEPDHYYIDGNNQLIFDAKYYNKISGINYKQICYHLFLKDIKDEEGNKKYQNTFSCLILPNEKRDTKEHFKIKKQFSNYINDITIMEEYFDIRKVMELYD